MSNGYERKTGPGMAYVLCDICGSKIRQKDAVLITDRYNTHYGLLVCKHDVDKTNQQDVPFSIRETQIQNPKLLRSEPPDQYDVNELDNRVPSAPMNLLVTLHPINPTVMLQWQGPQDVGSSQIIGYVITRAEPQLSTQFSIEPNTNSGATYYEDITADITLEYTYTVRAINSFGTGPDSEIVYFPRENVNPDIGLTYQYLIASDTQYTILTGDGDAIIVRI